MAVKGGGAQGPVQFPMGANNTEMTLPNGSLCHYITDNELEQLGQMKQEPVMEFFLAAVGAFIGSLPGAFSAVIKFNSAAVTMSGGDLFQLLLGSASFAIALVTGFFWHKRLKGRKSMVSEIRERPKVAVGFANVNS